MTGYRAIQFTRAAATYDRHSQVQRDMAARLSGLLPDQRDMRCILELGCGTGHFSRWLSSAYPQAAIVLSDVSQSMLEANRRAMTDSFPGRRLEWLRVDAEGRGPAPPGEAQGPFDLAASNALAQWFPDLTAHFVWAARRLRQGACYVVSGFSDDNFPELRGLLATGSSGHGNWAGHDAGRVGAAARTAGFSVEHWEAESWTRQYASVDALLECIKGLGASRRPEPGRRLGREGLRRLKEEYARRHAHAGGRVPATWKPWFARLRRTA